MKCQEQLDLAARLGRAAFERGVRCAPCLDAKCMAMLKGRPLGCTPAGEAESVAIMKAWTDAWVVANLAAPINGQPAAEFWAAVAAEVEGSSV